MNTDVVSFANFRDIRHDDSLVIFQYLELICY
jgi:hypothetical protein